MLEPAFGRCENSKKSHMQSSKIFISEKDFWVVNPERLDQKFWNSVFLDVEQKKKHYLVRISGCCV